MQRISFGTSGWRGILCEDFTLENVRLVTQAIADHVRANGNSGKGLIVGYDTRFMGERFAKEAARVLTGSGIQTFLCKRDTPTPVISFEILRRNTAGAINFTASHNPCEYNGIKFSPAWGGPALPETTKDIERRANEMTGEICYKEMFLDDAYRSGLLEEIDPREAYLKDLEGKIDFDTIAGYGAVAVNPLYGAGRGYLDEPWNGME
jgi:phosphomannomutase